LNLTFKVKCHFGNRVILKAWPIVILSGMVASFEHKMPSKVFLRALACRLIYYEVICISVNGLYRAKFGAKN